MVPSAKKFKKNFLAAQKCFMSCVLTYLHILIQYMEVFLHVMSK